jgi:hypothetical protein
MRIRRGPPWRGSRSGRPIRASVLVTAVTTVKGVTTVTAGDTFLPLSGPGGDHVHRGTLVP